MKLREIITVARQRTAYRYALIFVWLTPLLVMRFEAPPAVVRGVLDICLLLIAVMILCPPPGGFSSLLLRDGDRS